MENTNEIMTTNEEIEVIEATETEELDAVDCYHIGLGKGFVIGGAAALVAGLGYKFVGKPIKAKVKSMWEQHKAKKEAAKTVEVIDCDENVVAESVDVEESK